MRLALPGIATTELEEGFVNQLSRVDGGAAAAGPQLAVREALELLVDRCIKRLGVGRSFAHCALNHRSGVGFAGRRQHDRLEWLPECVGPKRAVSTTSVRISGAGRRQSARNATFIPRSMGSDSIETRHGINRV
jgi:hypothetical protein